MELTSRQIEDKHFTSALRGYDRGEVDAFAAACAAHTSSLEERTKIAEVRAAASEDELAGLRAEIDVLLVQATDARRKIIDEAREEASTIARQSEAAGSSPELVDAAMKATAIISEAETAADLRLETLKGLEKVAEDKAAAIVRRGEASAAMTQAEADRLLDKARLDSNSMREEAEALRSSMNAQLAEIQRLLGAARTDDAENPELVIDLTETRHATN